jgi:signal transduction histidine kinase/DNA-binding response OmpR family regulator
MILIVDDNQENIFSLRALLEIHKFNVDTASSGEEALKKILKQEFALIILDVQMPDMDGFEVAETISGYSKSKDIPIIFLSAVNTHKKFITRGYSSGAIDYITKPFDPDILLLKVKTFYRLSQQTIRLNEMEQSLRQEIEFRRNAELQLQGHLEELQSILETIPQIAFTLDKNGSIEFVNHLWFQYSHEKNVFPTTDKEPIKSLIQKIVAGKKQVVREIRIARLHSQEFLFHLLYLSPLEKNGEIVKWVGIFTDINEHKVFSEKLEKMVQERTTDLARTNEWLEKSNNELKQFAYIASHDLQEPLRKIQTFTNLVISRESVQDEKSLTYLNKIKSSADRLRRLVKDLLTYASIEGGDIDHFELTDLNTVVHEAIADLELLIEKKNARINIGPLIQIEIIPSQIRQVILNILNNALKFSKKNEPCQISIQGEIIDSNDIYGKPEDEGLYYRLTISDNGIGFNENFVSKIFEIFQRLNGRTDYEGTGIGLSLVKKIIEKHGGTISARSRENEGACFIIVLPLLQQKTALPA